MNRFFPNYIIYSFVCLYLITFGSNDTATAQKETPSASKSKVKNSNARFQLVPPPPPEQPSFLNLSNMPDLSASFLLYNETELKQKLAHLKIEILNAQDALNESNMQWQEAKEKSEHIDSLKDADQIFSRKELEAEKKKLSHKEHLAVQAKNDLDDLILQQNAILRRLALCRKQDKGTTNTSKKKMTINEKHK